MHKTCLKMHLIFVCKYRKRLLVKLGEPAKDIFLSIQEGRDFRILIIIEDFNLVPSDAANAVMTDADQQVMNACSDALLKSIGYSGVCVSSISGELTKALSDHFGVYKE